MATTVTVVVREGANGDVRFNSAWTGAHAEKEIRNIFSLQGGCLEDINTGSTLGDDDDLGERKSRIVGGRSTGNYLSFNHSCQHVTPTSFHLLWICFNISHLISLSMK